MKIKVSVALEKKLVERLDKIAAINGESRSQLIDRMVRDQIEGTEQLANLMANPQARAELIRQFSNPAVMGPMARAMGDTYTPAQGEKMGEIVERMGIETAKVKQKGKGKKS